MLGKYWMLWGGMHKIFFLLPTRLQQKWSNVTAVSKKHPQTSVMFFALTDTGCPKKLVLVNILSNN